MHYRTKQILTEFVNFVNESSFHEAELYCTFRMSHAYITSNCVVPFEISTANMVRENVHSESATREKMFRNH